MVSSAILIQWGTPVVGRERIALEEFGSYMQWVNRLKVEGKIERFEVYAPKYGNHQLFTGMTIVEGDDRQIEDLLESQDFRLRIDRVLTVTQNLRVERCEVGTVVGDRMKLYGQALQQLKL